MLFSRNIANEQTCATKYNTSPRRCCRREVKLFYAPNMKNTNNSLKTLHMCMTNDGDESECDDGTIYGGPESEVTLTVYVYKKPRFV